MKIIFEEVTKEDTGVLLDVSEALLNKAKEEFTYSEICKNSKDYDESLAHMEKAKNLTRFNDVVIRYLKAIKGEV